MSSPVNNTDQAWIENYRRTMDDDGYVEFNHDRRLGQNQYASRAVKGLHGSPCLGHGLRWKMDDDDYHNIRIHIDDLAVYHQRYNAWKDDQMHGRDLDRHYQIGNAS